MNKLSRWISIVGLSVISTVAIASTIPTLDFTAGGSGYEWGITPNDQGLFDLQHGDMSLQGRVFRGGRHWMADIDLEENGQPKQINMVTLQDGTWSPVGTICDHVQCKSWYVQAR